MTCENEASPSINSASPGAAGSTDIADMVGDDADKSTTTTLILPAIRRASVNTVNVMLSPEAVPRTVTLRAAPPARRKSSATHSISVGSGTASGAGSPRSCGRLTNSAARSAAGAGSAAKVASAAEVAAARSGAGEDANAAVARGAVMRSNSPVAIAPALSINVASVATSTIGSFFGYAGVLETDAREMIRPSVGPASMFSRVLASRYFAR